MSDKIRKPSVYTTKFGDDIVGTGGNKQGDMPSGKMMIVTISKCIPTSFILREGHTGTVYFLDENGNKCDIYFNGVAWEGKIPNGSTMRMYTIN